MRRWRKGPGAAAPRRLLTCLDAFRAQAELLLAGFLGN